jgi:hypothetical protein
MEEDKVSIGEALVECAANMIVANALGITADILTVAMAVIDAMPSTELSGITVKSNSNKNDEIVSTSRSMRTSVSRNFKIDKEKESKKNTSRIYSARF